MKKTRDVKEIIIQATTALIEENSGHVQRITARTIAERAGGGLGLINYPFTSKENLITICVQRIIGNVIAGFDTKKGICHRPGAPDCLGGICL